MKKIILAVFCLLIFSGCFSDWQGDGTGTIIINLGVGTGARSLWPDDHENIVEKLVYDIVLTSVGSDDIEYFKIQNELRVSVKAGDWNVKLTAYFPDVGPGIPYAIGTRPVFVIAGRNNDVDVKMDPMFCGVCKDYPCTCQAVECLCKDGENCICGDDCECDCDCCLFGCDECGECEECNPECEHAFPDEWDTITDPTCTEQGSEENKCDKCGASHEDSPRVIEKLQHNYPTNWTTIKPSTCAEAGSEEKKCPDCGTHAANSPRMIGQLQHNFPTNWTTVKPSTCAEAGSEEKKCPDCGTHAANSPRTIGQLQHLFNNYTYNNDATCEEDGTETATCDNIGCEETHEQPKEGSALDHSFNTIPATCTTNSMPGNCTREGCDARNQEPIENALGHDWDWNNYTTGSGLRECQRNVACTVKAGRGDIGPGGGIIFYSSEAGFTHYLDIHGATFKRCYYLEAAPVNVEGTFTWATPSNQSQEFGGLFNPIGNGLRNTLGIAGSDAPNSGIMNAARASRSYSNNNLNDWFLPNREELQQLYNNREFVGNLGTDTYWSSSQYISNLGYSLNFSNGNSQTSPKSSSLYVRAIRAF